MVEKRQLVHDERLQTGQALEDISKPVRVWTTVDLCMSRRKVQRVCHLSNIETGPRQRPLEADQRYYLLSEGCERGNVVKE